MNRLTVVLLCVVLVSLPAWAAERTITYWIWDINQLIGTEMMIEAFAAQYDIDVEVVLVPWGEYWDKLPVALASGAGPDVYWMTMYHFGTMREAGMVLNLQPLLDRDPEAQAHFDAMWPVLREAYSYQGDAYGFPRDYDSIAVFYNADAMAEAGLVEPKEIEDTWTWDDLLEYALRLTVRSGDEVRRWGYRSVNEGQQYWYNFIRANGGDIFNAEGTAATLNTPQVAQAIQFMVDLRHVYRVAPDGWDDGFIDGSIAMDNDGSWMFSAYIGVTPFEWNVAELPASPHTGMKSNVIHGLANVINPHTKDLEAAFTFAKFLASYEAQSILGATSTVIPSRMDASHTWFAPDLYPSNRLAFQRALAYAKPYPASPYVAHSVWSPVLNDLINQALTRAISVEEALHQADRFLNAVIQEAMRGK